MPIVPWSIILVTHGIGLSPKMEVIFMDFHRGHKKLISLTIGEVEFTGTSP